MRYAQIRSMDISNGKGIGVSLFVQGCDRRCKGCFNEETWDKNGGKEFTTEIENKFIDLISKPYIKRVSFLGGDPLMEYNVDDIYSIILKIKKKFPKKEIWLWTGRTITIDDILRYDCLGVILKSCNYVIDGAFIEEKIDKNIRFRGSSNQRVIDIQETLKNKKIILYKVDD